MINFKKIVGVYLIAFGILTFNVGIVDRVYDRLEMVDLRLDSANSKYRTAADNVESSVIVLSQFGGGSGFYITDHYIVTNAHVVSMNMFGTFLESSVVFTHDLDVPVKGRLVGVNTDLDLAIIWTPVKGTPVLTYNTKRPRVKDFIYSVGSNPRNLKSIKTGYITKLENDLVPQAFMTDSRLEPGFSGGGTFDRNDILVGISVAIGHNYKDQYSFVIDFSKVKGWLTKTLIRDMAEVTGATELESSND